MRALISVLLTLAGTSALAHSGPHDASLPATLWHLLTEPDHLALLVLALIVGIAGGAMYSRRAR